jgi:hypothetical protein
VATVERAMGSKYLRLSAFDSFYCEIDPKLFLLSGFLHSGTIKQLNSGKCRGLIMFATYIVSRSKDLHLLAAVMTFSTVYAFLSKNHNDSSFCASFVYIVLLPFFRVVFVMSVKFVVVLLNYFTF